MRCNRNALPRPSSSGGAEATISGAGCGIGSGAIGFVGEGISPLQLNPAAPRAMIFNVITVRSVPASRRPPSGRHPKPFTVASVRLPGFTLACGTSSSDCLKHLSRGWQSLCLTYSP